MNETPVSRRMKICLTCSHGGHLAEMLALREAFEGHETFYFCYDAETTRALPKAYRVPNMARNPIEFLKNLFRVIRIFRNERPDLVVSTGAEIAIPVVLVAKLFRVPALYIECGAQVTHPSVTGRVMYRLADWLFVQWPELLQAYGPRAEFRGSLIDEEIGGEKGKKGRGEKGEGIYVTVGTMFLDFLRLIRKMDEIARDTGERVIVQIGMGKTIPQHCEHFDFKTREEVLAMQGAARLIVCHGGIGAVTDALASGRPFIVVPRLKRFNEHMTDHQLELAEAVERRGWGRMILDADDLPAACANPPATPESYSPAKERLVAAVREVVDRVAAGARARGKV